MRILIADDEAPARSELRFMLEALLPEARFQEAVDGSSALALAQQDPPEVAFLDVRMPGLDGLEVALALLERPDPPLIVFATAYDQHAVRAFELSALDYIVKPFNEKRLARTVERVRAALAERRLRDDQRSAVWAYLQQAMPESSLTKLWGQRENEHWRLVDYKDVLWIVAEGKRVLAHSVEGESLQLHHTLKELEARLLPYRFVRVHKAYIVNLDHVAEVAPWFSGTYLVYMRDEPRTQIPMSRGYARHVRQLTGWK
jgi:DNA-binding LytR/AlgR family response regulator